MNINATLIGQAISFVFFVWFCMKFVWPPIMQAMDERKKTIADGLAAAERGMHEHELAQKKAIGTIHEAKQQANEIIARAEKRAAELVEASKDDARVEGQRIVQAARGEIDQEVHRAREELRGQVASLAVIGATRVLEREIDDAAHDAMLTKLVAEL
ncbi:MAG: F0F1 ATP synthase subunit B [Gammaproteobacteria bacterium]|nr:F0F1 ATP synthase subunit B [Gammaproteobacteria bacterium]